ncbi:RluA family pseudouridine synthase [Halobacillus litoralis]|uniref:RluA family pseudouridine synthase n=1 Tax=Halobacillus litoralis TaxID=45668 RepID=UPI001CFE3DF5|nr:RluA family pseudouridine synthase [Halobacillus litoralis]
MTIPINVSKTWSVRPPFAGRSIRDFLFEGADFSRQLLKKVRMNGKVYINDEERKIWQSVETGDVLTVIFPEEEKGAIVPIQGKLSIVYEDEDVLVIDKPSRLPVVPTQDSKEPSVASLLLYRYEQAFHPCTVHIVTRLDKDTSGLMLIAKHAYSHRLLTKGLKSVERRYRAVVHGVLTEKEGLIDKPIGRKEGSIIERAVAAHGKPSQTLYEVESQSDSYTWLRLRLFTGRTHQIRVHLSDDGYPLAGDTLYGGREVEGISGQALHCSRLVFRHPWTKNRMTFTSEPPEAWGIFN